MNSTMESKLGGLAITAVAALLSASVATAREIPNQPHIYGKCVEKSADGKCVKSDQDISPTEAYKLWEEKRAEIVDVRTRHEFKLIGHPGAREKKELLRRGEKTGRFYHPSIAINMPYPWIDMGFTGHEDVIDMGDINDPKDITDDELERFIKPFETHFPDREKNYIFIDRSWDRAVWAANIMFLRGYKNVYTVIGGFEGQPDATDGYRRTREGWLHEGLPAAFDVRH